MQKLFDSRFLPRAVHIGDFIVGQAAVVLVDLWTQMQTSSHLLHTQTIAVKAILTKMRS